MKRPGVEVRARRGYRATTAAEMTAAVKATPGSAMPANVQAAFAQLGAARADVRLRTRAGVVAGGEQARVWVLAELDVALARAAEWSGGGSVQISLASREGTPVSTAAARFEPGSRTVQVELTPGAIPAGEYQVRTRATPGEGGLPLSDVVGVKVLAEAGSVGPPQIGRRGPSTGLQYQPTADVRFRRTERVRFQWPVAAGTCVSRAEIVDQRGQPMAIPVTTLLNACETPSAGEVAGVEIALAPFAAADYGVRVGLKRGGGEQEAVAAFRIVP